MSGPEQVEASAAAADDDESRGRLVDVRLRTLAEGLARAVVAAPDAVAVEAGDVHVTYRWLDRAARRVAGELLARGAGPDRPVALLEPPSIAYVLCIAAAARAGIPYLPLDPNAPAARLAGMVGDARAALVVTRSSIELQAPCVAVDELAAAAPRAGLAPDRLLPAYVIFTSGSTGRPKGVVIQNDGIANFVDWMQRTHRLAPGTRVPLLANVAFDASVLEAWSALVSGATLVVGTPDLMLDVEALAHFFTLAEVTTAFLTTPVAEAALPLLNGPPGGALTTLWTGGDRLHAAPGRGASIRLWNLYGPTEVAVVSTGLALEAGGEGVPTIGWPLDDLHVYVVDDDWIDAWRGARGELWVGGAGVALGYLGDAARTADRFVPDPDADVDGARVYRTGDRVRWAARGGLSFEGRTDDQLKVRGQRVELGEVEHALRSIPAVRDAVVTVHRGSGGAELHGYVVCDEQLDWRAALRASLPEFMVPSTVQRIPAMPLTDRGKINRAALPPPARDRDGGVPPQGSDELAVAAAFADVLGVERVGRGESFFEIGGHSLLAARLVARLRDISEVELPLRAVFEAPTVEALARRLRERTSAAVASATVTRRPAGAPLVLSWAQERMWFLHRLAPASTAYHVRTAVWVDGPLDVAALRSAIEAVVRRHEPLRTAIDEIVGVPMPRLLEDQAIAWSVEDRAMCDESAAHELFGALAAQPFDLARGPLVRVLVARVGEARWLLGFVVHHVAIDGWSVGVLMRELSAAYAAAARGLAIELPDLTITHGDHAWHQRNVLADPALGAQLEHWKTVLAGVPTVLDVPGDRPRPRLVSSRGAATELAIPTAVGAGVDALSRSESATAFMVLLAAFEVFLWRQTGEPVFVVGTPVANRPSSALQELVGLFVNTLALRADLRDAKTFRDLVRRVRDVTIDALEHQDLPFEQLVDALELPRDLGRPPLVQVMFAVREAEEAAMSLGDLAVTPARAAAAHEAKFDLSVTLVESAGGLCGTLVHATDVFGPEIAARLARRFELLVEQLVGAPDAPLSASDGVPPSELAEILRATRGPTVPVDVRGLAARLHDVAVRSPDRIAVTSGDVHLSFAELMRRARALAREVADVTSGDDVVPLVVGRTPAAIVALVACAVAGRPFAPLDVKAPAARLVAMIENLGARCWLTDGVRELGVPGRIDVRQASAPRRSLASVAGPLPPGGIGAYVIHTSGTTGVPKPVLVTDRALHSLIDGLEATIPELRDPEARVALNANLSFDASLQQIGQLLLGRTLVLVEEEVRLEPRRMVELVGDQQVTVLDGTPSHLRLLVEAGLGDEPSLRALLVGGEVVEADLWSRFGTLRPAAYNVYGPTETAVDATCGRFVGPVRTAGPPLPNVTVDVLGPSGDAPAPPCVAGDVLIGGSGVGIGYLGMPSATAAAFIPDPAVPGGRRYRTGDIGRVLPGSGVDVVGRRDGQVKIRGHRVELGEIEATLRAVEGVADACVRVRPEDGGQPRLIAWVVGERADDSRALEAALRLRLPEHMVPRAWVAMAALPLTSSGKLDARALPDPAPTNLVDEPPQSPLEERVAAIVASVLGRATVGREASFFELGGHSLLAIRLVARLQRELGVDVPVRALFEGPTVRELAALLASAPTSLSAAGPRLHPVRHGTAPPVVLVHGVDGRTTILDAIAATFAPRAVFALEVADADQAAQLVDDDVALLRALGAPVVLVGWSLGAVLAAEVARRAGAGVVPAAILLDPHVIRRDAPPGDAGGVDGTTSEERVALAMRRAASAVGPEVAVEVPTLVVRAALEEAGTRLRVVGPSVVEAEPAVSHWTMCVEELGATMAVIGPWLAAARLRG